MKKLKFILPFFLIFLVTGLAFSQKGWNPGSKYNRMYDKDSVITISGIVTAIDNIKISGTNATGVHISVKTENQTMQVHLGPAWYIDKQTVQIQVNDKVNVTGSRVYYKGDEVIIAKEITKDGQVLKLRDDDGYPYWAGRK
jgi:hypothetical protein